jgi:4-diphosphocytidyl-2-C-methyl-D-erythritol kinase
VNGVSGDRNDRISTDVLSRVAHTRPPAKLNLFLELLARRDDGFHEIDTVMVPIDWYDELRVLRTDRQGIELSVDWLPSKQIVARRLGLDPQDEDVQRELAIPCDENNLVHRALTRFVETFDVEGGFHCQLGKSIPAGAGLGGASSDAASALRSAAALCGIPHNAKELNEVAAEIGSDVPFFLGLNGQKIAAGRAQGRGERISAVSLTSTIYFVVIFSGVTLSTGLVYANSQVSHPPQDADRLIAALEGRSGTPFESQMLNRLSDPAKELAPRINDTLESLWRSGLRTCQLTGSGSACFAVASTFREANRCAARLRSMVEPGAVVMTAKSVSVPVRVDMT